MTALGTDGFGRSDTRAALRGFFEVDRQHIVLAALSELAHDAAGRRALRRGDRALRPGKRWPAALAELKRGRGLGPAPAPALTASGQRGVVGLDVPRIEAAITMRRWRFQAHGLRR